MWLLRLPSLRKTRYLPPSNVAVSSLVVVLPTLPVMATTSAADRRRTTCAMPWSADTVSSTTMTIAACRGGSAETSLTITPAAPFSIASATNRCPSTRSPRIARNTSPARTRRLSIENPPSVADGDPATSRPRAAVASSSARSTTGSASATVSSHPTRAPARRRANAARATDPSSNGRCRAPMT